MKLDENDLAASTVELARDVARSIDSHEGQSYPVCLVTLYRSTMKELGRQYRAQASPAVPAQPEGEKAVPASRLQEPPGRRFAHA